MCGKLSLQDEVESAGLELVRSLAAYALTGELVREVAGNSHPGQGGHWALVGSEHPPKPSSPRCTVQVWAETCHYKSQACSVVEDD